MKKLDVSAVSNAAQMKLKSGTLQFLQDANAEALTAICLGLIGSNYSALQVYVLWGCTNSGSGNSYNISAGAVFYNGEIYLVDAASFTLNGNVAIFSAVTTQYTVNADPVTFSDLSVHNIHNIRKMQILGGTTGSMNYENAKGILEFVPAQLNLKGDGAAEVSGTYPNMTVYVSPQNNAYPIIYAGSIAVPPDGNVATGGQDLNVSFPQALTSSNYTVMCQIVSNPTSTDPQSDTTCFATVRGRTINGFIIRIQEYSNFTQNISVEFIVIAK